MNRQRDLRGLRLGIALAVVSAIFFATNTPLSKVVYASGQGAMAVIVARAACALTLCTLICVLSRQPLVSGLDIRGAGLLALFMFGQGAMYIGSVKFISVTLAAILFFTWPLLIGLSAVSNQSATGRAVSIACFLVAFVGLVLAFGLDISVIDRRGVALAICGSFCMAGYVLCAQRFTSKSTRPLGLNIQINLGIVLLGVVTMLIFDGFPNAVGFDEKFVYAIAALSIFYTVATVTQLVAIKYGGAAPTAIAFNLEPVASILLAVAFLGDTLSFQIMLGGLLVISSLIVYSTLALRCEKPEVTRSQ
ncbi:MAG: DMT family transporter [Pseudomonadota bacterium]